MTAERRGSAVVGLTARIRRRRLPRSPAAPPGPRAAAPLPPGYPRKYRIKAKTTSGNAMMRVSPMTWRAMNGTTPR